MATKIKPILVSIVVVILFVSNVHASNDNLQKQVDDFLRNSAYSGEFKITLPGDVLPGLPGMEDIKSIITQEISVLEKGIAMIPGASVCLDIAKTSYLAGELSRLEEEGRYAEEEIEVLRNDMNLALLKLGVGLTIDLAGGTIGRSLGGSDEAVGAVLDIYSVGDFVIKGTAAYTNTDFDILGLIFDYLFQAGEAFREKMAGIDFNNKQQREINAAFGGIEYLGGQYMAPEELEIIAEPISGSSSGSSSQRASGGSGSSSSSGPRLGDISIDSNVGDVTVINKTRRDLEVNIHSVEATGRAKTGDISISSRKGNDITVIKDSRKDASEVNIGSVKVGD